MSTLRQRTIRLAYGRPDLRPHLMRALTAMEPSLSKREPLVGPLAYRYKISMLGEALALSVYDGQELVGGINASYVGNMLRVRGCQKDVLTIIDRFPEIEDRKRPRWVSDEGAVPRVKGLSVTRSDLFYDKHRGKGYGVAMYIAVMRAYFDKVGPFLFMPDMCTSGTTSKEARYVWQSLARKFPSEGYVIAVLTRP